MKKLFPLTIVLLFCVGLREPRTLRVCADPAALPYSNEKREGFENRIADIVADELGARVEDTWFVQRRGFFRNTLNAGRCDVVIGVPKGIDLARTTKPYYRSAFAFVVRRDSRFADVRSIDDERLKHARIGVPLAGDDGANPGPVHALSRRGIVDGVVGFPLYAELGRDVPAIVDAVANGTVDVGVVWGPIAAYGAQKRERDGLVVTTIAEREDDGIPFTFAIAMGVRRGDRELAAELDRAIDARRADIAKVLHDAHVPEVSDAP
jgi:mxaJ protein